MVAYGGHDCEGIAEGASETPQRAQQGDHSQSLEARVDQEDRHQSMEMDALDKAIVEGMEHETHTVFFRRMHFVDHAMCRVSAIAPQRP